MMGGLSLVLVVFVVILFSVGIGLVIWRWLRPSENEQASELRASLEAVRRRPREEVPAKQQPSKKPPAPPPQPAKTEPVSVSPVGPAVFVSYRREDTNDVTGRIYDRLIQHFGKDAVFKDVDSIPLGVDFRKHLGDSVGQCSVLLAIIGREWLAGGIKTGGRGLSDPRDYVKIEIESALQREIPVIPVLVQGTIVPKEEDLPESLQSLAYRNGISVRADPDFHQDVDRLVKGIESHLNKRNC
jgi:hypothetical protein